MIVIFAKGVETSHSVKPSVNHPKRFCVVEASHCMPCVSLNRQVNSSEVQKYFGVKLLVNVRGAMVYLLVIAHCLANSFEYLSLLLFSGQSRVQ